MAEHCEESKIAKLPRQTGGEEEGGVGAKTIYTGEKKISMKLGTRKQVAFNELREKQKRASC